METKAYGIDMSLVNNVLINPPTVNFIVRENRCRNQVSLRRPGPVSGDRCPHHLLLLPGEPEGEIADGSAVHSGPVTPCRWDRGFQA